MKTNKYENFEQNRKTWFTTQLTWNDPLVTSNISSLTLLILLVALSVSCYTSYKYTFWNRLIGSNMGFTCTVYVITPHSQTNKWWFTSQVSILILVALTCKSKRVCKCNKVWQNVSAVINILAHIWLCNTICISQG